MAVLSVISYIGAMCAPFLVELNRVHPKLPYGTMAALAIISGLLCWILPETKGRPTVEIYENNNGKVILYLERHEFEIERRHIKEHQS